jgi:hypothetical protein
MSFLLAAGGADGDIDPPTEGVRPPPLPGAGAPADFVVPSFFNRGGGQ